MSIQYKHLLVFGIVIGFAGCVAVYAVNAISKSSELVVRMYDEPLMGINEARSAHARLIDANGLMRRAIAMRESPANAANELEQTISSALRSCKLCGNECTMTGFIPRSTRSTSCPGTG
jgi:methyl-accepting chemotaxis protein